MVLVGGWRNAFYFFGGLMLLTTALWLVLAREHRHPEYQARMAAQEGTPLKVLVRYRMLWLLAFCQIGSALAWLAFLTFWPTFAIQAYGLPLITAGYLIGLLPFGSIFGSFLSGILSDRLGLRKPLIWIPGLCLPVCYLVVLYTDSVPVLAGVLFFIGFCAFVVVPIIYTFPYELEGIRPREIAVASGLVYTVTTFGGSLGPLVAGFVTQATGSLHGALVFCAMCAVTLGVLPMFLPETGWRAQRRRAAKP
jgi:ACS family glucarate transporter-like MFS transporter